MPTALVTGAASGIGRAIASHFSGQGWQVIGLDIALVDLPGVTPVACDVSDESAVAGAFAGLSGRLEPGLDLLVNCAGIAAPETGPPEALSLDSWSRVLAVNLTGPMLMTRAAIPHLRRARGAVVNITSTRAHMSEPHTEAYAASKGGLTALTHALAISLGPDIRVNAIAPGWIDTSGGPLSHSDHAQHPAGRVGRPQDVAEAVAYMAGAGFLTGAVLILDGGMTRKMIYAE